MDAQTAATAAIVVPAATATLAAVLSTTVAIVTVSFGYRTEAARRRLEIEKATMQRRIEAIEQAWLQVFEIESSGKPSIEVGDLVRGSVWMSERLQSSYIQLLSSHEATPAEYSRVRSLLREEITAVTTAS